MDENPYKSPQKPAREGQDLRASRNTIESILALSPRQRAAAIVILVGALLGFAAGGLAYWFWVADPANPKTTSPAAGGVIIVFSLAGAIGGAAVASVGVAVAALVCLLCRRWRHGRGKSGDSEKQVLE